RESGGSRTHFIPASRDVARQWNYGVESSLDLHSISQALKIDLYRFNKQRLDAQRLWSAARIAALGWLETSLYGCGERRI
ncbi:MAG TPA: hypothetical protein VK956_12040, partial [Verrucomicrobium sp.]|nr:hypothetical protein [Verrucomicrobium sp.]